VKVPRHVVDGRRRKLAELLQRHRYLPLQDLCKEFNVSEATIRRDLAWLETNQLVTRTYGGALADFNLRFPSFRQRRANEAKGKRQLAARAHALVRPQMTVFLDAGTTLFALAELLRERPVLPLVCVTSNLPAADLLSEVPGIAVHLLGGQLLHRQSVLVGRGAVNNVSLWEFDRAFFSAQGMTAEGLWNSQPEVVELQRAALSRARHSLFLLDASKIGRTTPHFLLAWDKVEAFFTDASAEQLSAAGLPPQTSEVLQNDVASTATPASTRTDVDREPEPEFSSLTLPTSLL
jgi:DeoR/GlpR family transcriptional regulator of sugar metabolism